MAVIPLEFDGVLTHWLSVIGLCRRFEHGQRPGSLFGPLTRFPATLQALVIAQGAGAGIPQVGKRVTASMAVFPLDFHASAGADVHLNCLRIGFETDRHIFSIA